MRAHEAPEEVKSVVTTTLRDEARRVADAACRRGPMWTLNLLAEWRF